MTFRDLGLAHYDNEANFFAYRILRKNWEMIVIHSFKRIGVFASFYWGVVEVISFPCLSLIEPIKKETTLASGFVFAPSKNK